jgi:hypothetical protein
MPALLAKAKSSGGEIWAALYELNDPELIPTKFVVFAGTDGTPKRVWTGTRTGR